MDVRFHCSKRVRHSGKKSKHRVMETYFKGEREDLTQVEYKELASSAAAVFDQPMLYEWD